MGTVDDEGTGMESGVGVNSPEFLQKKIERLKTALEEANVLMDRQVTERDEARAELANVKRENTELKRQLEQGGGAAAAAPAAAEGAPAADPAVEKELRDRIAQLESEREAFEAADGATDADQAAQSRIDYLQSELDTARRDLETARRSADDARRDADNARRDADSARTALNSLPGRTESTASLRTVSEPNLPSPGPFVSQEVIRDALDNDN